MSSIYDSREKFEQFVAAQVVALWAMYDDLQNRPIPPDDEDVSPPRSFAEDKAEMTEVECEKYLDDWATNMPEDIFEALVARRSERLAAEVERWQQEVRTLSHEVVSKPYDAEVYKRYHAATDNFTAALTAYNNR